MPFIVRPAPAALRRALVCFAAAGLTGLFGCGTDSTPTGNGNGDSGGFRLGAFVSDRNNAAGQTDLYLWDYDANAFRDLPALVRSTAAERHPSISSDGRFIALQIDRGTGTDDDIEIYDRVHVAFVNLPGLNTAAPESEPVFTGDGLNLCFVQGSATRRIRLYDGRTKQLVPLPGLDGAGPYSDYSPAPNHDGSLIAFVSDRSGSPDILIWSRARSGLLDGPKLRQALVSGADDLDPSFSSDGRFLAFSSDRAGAQGLHDLYVLEFAFSVTQTDTVLHEVPAANSPSDERHPAISDNGAVLVFQSDRSGGQGRWDLWDYQAGSPAPTQAAGYDSPGEDIEPSIKWPN